ncbi:hypothetical protein [Haloimpatiens massiliensis]|uniref:hypothetical protein n=1 Tax=Haloimpatiens massiliensis TaxID=1658110 RepID=UPI0015E06BE5|nr:hypothetical protein [Haloimpatiens massiliensis]
MKKTMKTMVCTLGMLLLLNNGAKIVNVKTTDKQSKSSISITSQVKGMNSNIDPDSEDS